MQLIDYGIGSAYKDGPIPQLYNIQHTHNTLLTHSFVIEEFTSQAAATQCSQLTEEKSISGRTLQSSDVPQQ